MREAATWEGRVKMAAEKIDGGCRVVVKDGERDRENGRGVKNIGRDNAGGGQRWQQRKLGG